jgi:hypothetical protein
VACNGAEAQSLEINQQNQEVMHLISLTRHLRPGDNRVELRASSDREVACQ